MMDEVKKIHMTDEYAANYYLKQGYMAARLEMMMEESDDN
jgi:hypothetical protein